LQGTKKNKERKTEDGVSKPRGESNSDISSILRIIKEVYEELPFNRLLGLKVDYLTTNSACLKFRMRDELVGNYVQGILHGGVISAVLDATGGITATVSALERSEGIGIDEVTKRLMKISTIDMRVDYLRPGKGEAFFSKGTVMRTGRKVAVTRMELRNQQELLIAVGTGAYIVG
jgi:uncharacterized protein (TIGR00369 family)